MIDLLVPGSRPEINLNRQCMVCGCTEEDPCIIRNALGNVYGCWWIADNVCCMPLCRQALGPLLPGGIIR